MLRTTLPNSTTGTNRRARRACVQHAAVGGRQRGVTLVELGVVLTMLAILIAVARPSFSSLIEDNRRRIAFDELRVAIAYARSESIRRVGRVTLCESTDGQSCKNAPEKPDKGHFEGGWLVFHDRNTESEGSGKRGVVEIDGNSDDDRPLRFFQPELDAGQTISFRDSGGTKVIGYVSFNNRGLPLPPTPVRDFSFPLRIYYCDLRGKTEAVRVDLSAGGALSGFNKDNTAPRCGS